MIPLTEREKIHYENATVCSNCKNHFDQNSRIKLRYHCHTTGRFLGAVCSKCNLQLTYRKRKRTGTSEYEFFIPVIAHNMKGYDSHLIIKHYERHANLDFPINVIPNKTEKFVSFQIGKLRFLDSLQFLNASLDKSVVTCPRTHSSTRLNFLHPHNWLDRKAYTPTNTSQTGRNSKKRVFLLKTNSTVL